MITDLTNARYCGTSKNNCSLGLEKEGEYTLNFMLPSNEGKKGSPTQIDVLVVGVFYEKENGVKNQFVVLETREQYHHIFYYDYASNCFFPDFDCTYAELCEIYEKIKIN